MKTGLVDYIVANAEKNGTVGVLKQVAPHLDEAELQAVLKAVRGIRIKRAGDCTRGARRHHQIAGKG